jgi:hypothetical protein
MDGYRKILLTMQRQGKKFNPPSIGIGKVTSPPPNLIIEFNDIPLYSDDILIADYLLNNSVTTLNKDDLVALMPTLDQQIWIVLCKAVSLNG